MKKSRLTEISRIATETGSELLALFQAGNSGGEIKSDHTLVTAADRQADALIQGMIRKRYPGEGILSEEQETRYPETSHAWVIDPLDGTVNFSRGLHYWGIAIAHMVDGYPHHGAIYFPTVDELYTAARGKGAHLNGKSLSLEGDPSGEFFPLFVHCSRMHQRYTVRTRYKKRSLGAAAYHLCLVAKGKAALALESTPRIWDFAAAWLIIEEAGGVIRTLEGDGPFPAQPGKNYSKKPFPILAARSAAILAEAVSSIKPRGE